MPNSFPYQNVPASKFSTSSEPRCFDARMFPFTITLRANRLLFSFGRVTGAEARPMTEQRSRKDTAR